MKAEQFEIEGELLKDDCDPKAVQKKIKDLDEEISTMSYETT
jgi:hypothetical protein